eukprot:5471660-Pyramimonas_sp.AAC.1
MMQTEGGWPKGIDPTEMQDTWKKINRLEKDPTYTAAVKNSTSQTVNCIGQKNTIELSSYDKRNVIKIGWHPEAPNRLVCSHSNFPFQRMTDEMPMNSFIWDINDRNEPLTELRTPSPMVRCQYNHRNQDFFVE